jgi:hypothetical protein
MSGSKIAVPYYGQLARPSEGLERVYFIMEAVPANSAPEQFSLGVWNAREDASLPEWLDHNGVGGIVCRDTPHARIIENMVKHGISIQDEASEESRHYLKVVQMY